MQLTSSKVSENITFSSILLSKFIISVIKYAVFLSYLCPICHVFFVLNNNIIFSLSLTQTCRKTFNFILYKQETELNLVEFLFLKALRSLFVCHSVCVHKWIFYFTHCLWSQGTSIRVSLPLPQTNIFPLTEAHTYSHFHTHAHFPLASLHGGQTLFPRKNPTNYNHA